MNFRSIAKLLYSIGMGLFGKSIGRYFGKVLNSPLARKLVELVGGITGLYAGILLANNIEESIDIAISAAKDPDEVEVNP